MLKFLEIVSLAYMTNGIELGTGAVPADEFNLTNFKLQVPYSSTGSFTSGTSSEIKQPALAKYSYDNLFYLSLLVAEPAIVFRTPVRGLTTSGSKYPRLELREMTNSGATMAAWNSNDGLIHTIDVS